jgi:hypothetical protein
VLVDRLLDEVKDVRGFHHRSSHHHGSHLAFVKATPRRYPMQAIADGFSHLVVAYIDEPFRRVKREAVGFAFGCRATELGSSALGELCASVSALRFISM